MIGGMILVALDRAAKAIDMASVIVLGIRNWLLLFEPYP